MLVQEVNRFGPPGSVRRVENGSGDRAQCRDHLRTDEDQVFLVGWLPVAREIHGICETVQYLEFRHFCDCADINSVENFEGVFRRLWPVSTGRVCIGMARMPDVRAEPTTTR